MAGLMLDGEAAAACERDFEMPLPYYIDFGRDFVLLPMFGGLMNACAGLVWHLRKTYRRDWDRAVDGRERLFRDDLRALFSPDRYFVSDRGFPLRRSDGSELTDIDAAIVDRDTKTVALVQLKWHDIYGHSLSERNSRRINLLKAEQWVDRVSGWVNGRTAGEIADVLGLPAGGTRPPILLVIARHAAQFAGDTKYDSRATWISWPRVVQAHRASPRADILVLLKKARTTRQARHKRASPSEIHLPGLTVEIRTQ
jgi:hypothetical protein